MSKLDELLGLTQTNEEELSKVGSREGGGTKDPNSPTEWKLKPGDQGIRVLPALDGIPFKQLHVHWKVGKRPFLCPKKNFGEPCSVCDFGWALWNEAGEDKKLKEKAKIFLPGQSFAALVLDRELEKEDIEKTGLPIARIWDFNYSTWKDLSGIRNNKYYKNIESIMNGNDLTVTWNEANAKARLQATTIITIPVKTRVLDWTDKESPYHKLISSDEEMAEMVFKILENAPELYARYPRLSTEEVFEILQAYEEAPSENSPEITKYGGADKTKPNTGSPERDAIASKINKLFEEQDVDQ